MAIAIDQTSLGGNGVNATSTTIAFTTSAAVASGGFIVIEVSWYATGVTLSSVAGGSLTWAVAVQGASTTDANIHSAIAYAQAPSGLASSTTITATLSATSIDRTIGGASYTGVATSSPLGTTSGPTNGTTTAWTTASTAISAGSLLVGANFNGGFTTPTSTPTSPSIETVDRGDTDGNSATMAYRIETVASSYTVAGTWTSTSGAHVTVAAEFFTAGGAPAIPPIIVMPPRRP